MPAIRLMLKKIRFFFVNDSFGLATVFLLLLSLILGGLSQLPAVPSAVRTVLAFFLLIVLGDWFGRGLTSLFPKIHFPFFCLGAISVFFVWAFLLSPFLLWWKFFPWQILAALAGTVLSASWVRFISRARLPQSEPELQKKEKFSWLFWIILFFDLAILGLLILSRQNRFFLSPWDVIHPLLPGALLLLLFGVGAIIIKQASEMKNEVFHFRASADKNPAVLPLRGKTLAARPDTPRQRRGEGFFFSGAVGNRQALFLIVAASIVIHLAFPIVYDVGFSGDRWRHLATVQQLERGEAVEPVLFGEKISRVPIGSLSVPEVLVAGNKQSYVSQWSMELLISRAAGIDLFAFDKWFMPLAWAVAVPLLLFLLGGVLEFSFVGRLLLAFVPLIASPFFVYGSTTLPKAFNFLPFIFFIIICVSLIGARDAGVGRRRNLLIVGLILSVFSYVPYAILLFIAAAYIWIDHYIKRAWLRVGLAGVTAALTAGLFMFLDTIRGYSTFIVDRLHFKTFLNLSWAYFLRLLNGHSLFPYPFAIEQENAFFTQPYSALVDSVFLGEVRWVRILLPFLILVMIGGAILLLRRDLRRGLLFLSLAAGSFGAMFLSSVLLTGNHIVTKRLVVVVPLFLFPFVAVGFGRLVRFLQKREIPLARGAVAFVIGFMMLVSLVSGPRIQRVTKSELESAYRILDSVDSERPCVVANTWPLLALEAASGGQIVNGGFPLYPPEFGSPERVSLYESFLRLPSVRYLAEAQKLTGSSKGCVVMIEEWFLKPYTLEPSLEPFVELMGQPEMIGEVAIWRWGAK